MKPSTDYRAHRGRCLDQLDALAGDVRRQLLPRLKPTDALPVPKLLHLLNEGVVEVEGHELRLRTYPAAHLPCQSVWAATHLSSSGRILLGFCRTAWAELQAGAPRTKFTALHELAHALLHHQELATFGQVPHAPAGATTPEADWCLEAQANRLAGALLMPATPLHQLAKRGRLSVDALVARYEVTPMAAERRIREVIPPL